MAIGQILFFSKSWKDLGKGLFQRVTTLGKKLPANADYSVASFISGMEPNGSLFSVKLGQLLFNQTTNELQINFKCRGRENLKSINFTYIVFPRTHAYIKMVYTPFPANKG